MVYTKLRNVCKTCEVDDRKLLVRYAACALGRIGNGGMGR